MAANKQQNKRKKFRKKLEEQLKQYKTVEQINYRLEVMIRAEMEYGEFTPEEEYEFVELKRRRSQIDPSIKFFG